MVNLTRCAVITVFMALTAQVATASVSIDLVENGDSFGLDLSARDRVQTALESCRDWLK